MGKRLNNYDIRKNYIDKVGKLLLHYQRKGYLILNKDGEVVNKIEQKDLAIQNLVCV